MNVTFLGTTACIPDAGEDCPCFLVNGNCLFDCGWYSVGDLRECGIAPENIRTLVFTHMHHDHYLGLPTLLFYYIHSRKLPLDELTIAGPAEDLPHVIDTVYALLQTERFYPDLPRPKLILLHPGDRFETDGLSFTVGKSDHQVQALSYRVTDKKDGRILGASGDAVAHPESIPFFAGCHALIHDATLGWNETEPPKTGRGHSTLQEAAQTALGAGAPVLYPVHMARNNAKNASERWMAAHPDAPLRIVPPERGRTYDI